MIRIVQCLCGPKRHCLMGIAYDPGKTAASVASGDDVVLTEATAAPWLRTLVKGLIRPGCINPWCGICGSKGWFYEDAPTRFKTIDEAEPEMRRLELEQARSRQMIDELKRTAEQN
jgi:hypothetical protein